MCLVLSSKQACTLVTKALLAPVERHSNIIERIAEGRRDRHHVALEDMHHELGLINAVSPSIYLCVTSLSFVNLGR